jgi:hypothetical protein
MEDAMKELTIEEVLRIAGGLPLASALDELTYRTPDANADPADGTRDLVAALRQPQGD